jgi:hypothetical protein
MAKTSSCTRHESLQQPQGLHQQIVEPSPGHYQAKDQPGKKRTQPGPGHVKLTAAEKSYRVYPYRANVLTPMALKAGFKHFAHTSRRRQLPGEHSLKHHEAPASYLALFMSGAVGGANFFASGTPDAPAYLGEKLAARQRGGSVRTGLMHGNPCDSLYGFATVRPSSVISLPVLASA